jgi:transcriptional regulator with XRE-family HTH domain
VPAGQKLKGLRHKCNITVREVEQASRRIAEVKGDKRFRISNGWLAQLENGMSEPSICKLFSLSVIYHANFLDLLRLYDVNVDERDKYESVANPHSTQLLRPESAEELRLPSTPSNAQGFTTLLPVSTDRSSTTKLSHSMDRGSATLTCGYIGLNDFTMYPLIRPGSLLWIDTSQSKLQSTSWHNEFERPIYFIELREAYACGWCELQTNQLLIIPHPSSPASIRRFTYPREAEIIGRVISYNTSCVDHVVNAANAKEQKAMRAKTNSR